MFRAAAVSGLAFLLAALPPAFGFQISSGDWALGGRLAPGLSKQKFLEVLGVASRDVDCASAPRNAMRIPDVDICRWRSGAASYSSVVVRSRSASPVVVAYSAKGEAVRFAALKAVLDERLKGPLRQSNGPWGLFVIWQFGGKQIAIRSACEAQTSCLEVSLDGSARRLATSVGVFDYSVGR